MRLKLYFVGPELSIANDRKTVKKNDRLEGQFFRGKISEFLNEVGKSASNEDVLEALDKKKTMFLGYNPGFGSGFDVLLESWACDIVRLLDLRYAVFFTQANDYSDVRGEMQVFQVLF